MDVSERYSESQTHGIDVYDSIHKDGKKSFNFYGLILTYFENANLQN